MAERLRALFLNLSCHRRVWCGFELCSGLVTQAKFCLLVCQMVFLVGSPVFAPPTDWPVSNELK